MSDQAKSEPVWNPLIATVLDVEPSALSKLRTESMVQLAKDADYAKAVQKAWRQEVEARSPELSVISNGIRPHRYIDADGTELHGYIVQRENASAKSPFPAVIFFHTGAGPHDVFLQWKADSLVTSFPDGCVVFVADMLSDESGWSWSPDRTRYNHSREILLKAGKASSMGVRPVLRTRIQAILKELERIPEVDNSRLAAMGWCFGGHPILEMGRMNLANVRAMVTFHGVFDGVSPPQDKQAQPTTSTKVLICHGAEDPFVSQSNLDSAMATFSHFGYNVELVSFENTRHGFTNPAQDFNPNPSFAFHADSAKAAWSSAIDLIKATLTQE